MRTIASVCQDKLDGIIVSHTDYDHLRGIVRLLEECPQTCPVLITEDFRKRKEKRIIKALFNCLQDQSEARSEQAIHQDLHKSFYCFFHESSPGLLCKAIKPKIKEHDIDNESTVNDPNRASIILQVKRSDGKIDVCLTGDAPGHRIVQCTKGKTMQVFQVSHHGSRLNSVLRRNNKQLVDQYAEFHTYCTIADLSDSHQQMYSLNKAPKCLRKMWSQGSTNQAKKLATESKDKLTVWDRNIVAHWKNKQRRYKPDQLDNLPSVPTHVRNIVMKMASRDSLNQIKEHFIKRCRTLLCKEFYEHVQAATYVITSGRNNHSHPHKEVLNGIAEAAVERNQKCQIVLTNSDGVPTDADNLSDVFFTKTNLVSLWYLEGNKSDQGRPSCITLDPLNKDFTGDIHMKRIILNRKPSSSSDLARLFHSDSYTEVKTDLKQKRHRLRSSPLTGDLTKIIQKLRKRELFQESKTQFALKGDKDTMDDNTDKNLDKIDGCASLVPLADYLAEINIKECASVARRLSIGEVVGIILNPTRGITLLQSFTDFFSENFIKYSVDPEQTSINFQQSNPVTVTEAYIIARVPKDSYMKVSDTFHLQVCKASLHLFPSFDESEQLLELRGEFIFKEHHMKMSATPKFNDTPEMEFTFTDLSTVSETLELLGSKCKSSSTELQVPFTKQKIQIESKVSCGFTIHQTFLLVPRVSSIFFNVDWFTNFPSFWPKCIRDVKQGSLRLALVYPIESSTITLGIQASFSCNWELNQPTKKKAIILECTLAATPILNEKEQYKCCFSLRPQKPDESMDTLSGAPILDIISTMDENVGQAHQSVFSHLWPEVFQAVELTEICLELLSSGAKESFKIKLDVGLDQLQLITHKLELNNARLLLEYSSDGIQLTCDGELTFFKKYSAYVSFTLPTPDSSGQFTFENYDPDFTLECFINEMFNLRDKLSSVPVLHDFLSVSINSIDITFECQDSKTVITRASVHLSKQELNLGVATLSGIEITVSLDHSGSDYDIDFTLSGFIGDKLYAQLQYSHEDSSISILRGDIILASFQNIDGASALEQLKVERDSLSSYSPLLGDTLGAAAQLEVSIMITKNPINFELANLALNLSNVLKLDEFNLSIKQLCFKYEKSSEGSKTYKLFGSICKLDTDESAALEFTYSDGSITATIISGDIDESATSSGGMLKLSSLLDTVQSKPDIPELDRSINFFDLELKTGSIISFEPKPLSVTEFKVNVVSHGELCIINEPKIVLSDVRLEVDWEKGKKLNGIVSANFQFSKTSIELICKKLNNDIIFTAQKLADTIHIHTWTEVRHICQNVDFYDLVPTELTESQATPLAMAINVTRKQFLFMMDTKFGSGVLYIGKSEATQKFGLLLAISLKSGFKFQDLSQQLALIDNGITIRNANLIISTLYGEMISDFHDSITELTQDFQCTVPFDSLVSEFDLGQQVLTSGVSIYAEMDIHQAKDSLLSNIVKIQQSEKPLPNVMLKASIVKDQSTSDYDISIKAHLTDITLFEQVNFVSHGELCVINEPKIVLSDVRLEVGWEKGKKLNGIVSANFQFSKTSIELICKKLNNDIIFTAQKLADTIHIHTWTEVRHICQNVDFYDLVPTELTESQATPLAMAINVTRKQFLFMMDTKFGSGVLYIGKSEATQKFGLLLAISLKSGFKFQDLSQQLALIDNGITIRNANLIISTLYGEMISDFHDSITELTQDFQCTVPFDSLVSEFDLGQQVLTSGVSIYAEMDIHQAKDSLLSNIVKIQQSEKPLPNVMLKASIVKDQSTSDYDISIKAHLTDITLFEQVNFVSHGELCVINEPKIVLSDVRLEVGWEKGKKLNGIVSANFQFSKTSIELICKKLNNDIIFTAQKLADTIHIHTWTEVRHICQNVDFYDLVPTELTESQATPLAMAINTTRKQFIFMMDTKFGSGVLFMGKSEATQKFGLLLAISLKSGFKFQDLSQQLTLIDNGITIRNANLIISTLYGEMISDFHDSITELTQDFQCTVPFDSLVSEFDLGQQVLTSGVSIYAEMDIHQAKDSLLSNIVKIQQGDKPLPNVILKASIVKDQSTSDYDVSIEAHLTDITLFEQVNFQNISLLFQLSRKKSFLKLSGTMCLEIAASYKFDGAIIITKSDATFDVKKKASDEPLVSPLGMDITLTDLSLKGDFNFKGSPPEIELSGGINLGHQVDISAMVLFSGIVPNLVIIDITSELSIGSLLQCVGKRRPGTLVDLKILNGHFHYARVDTTVLRWMAPKHLKPYEPIVSCTDDGSVVYKKGIHAKCDVQLFFEQLRFDIRLDIAVDMSSLKISGRSCIKIDLTYVKLTDQEFKEGPCLSYEMSLTDPGELKLAVGLEILGKPWFSGTLSYPVGREWLNGTVRYEGSFLWMEKPEIEVKIIPEVPFILITDFRFGRDQDRSSLCIFDLLKMLKQFCKWLLKLVGDCFDQDFDLHLKTGANPDPTRYSVALILWGTYKVVFLDEVTVSIDLPELEILVPNGDTLDKLPKLIVDTLSDAGEDIVKSIVDFIKNNGLLDTIQAIVSTSLSIASSTVKVVAEGVKKIGNAVIRGVETAVNSIGRWFMSIFGSIKIISVATGDVIAEIMGGRYEKQLCNEKKVVPILASLIGITGIHHHRRHVYTSGRAAVQIPAHNLKKRNINIEEMEHMVEDLRDDHYHELDSSLKTLASTMLKVDSINIAHTESNTIQLEWKMDPDVMKVDEGDFDYHIKMLAYTTEPGNQYGDRVVVKSYTLFDAIVHHRYESTRFNRTIDDEILSSASKVTVSIKAAITMSVKAHGITEDVTIEGEWKNAELSLKKTSIDPPSLIMMQYDALRQQISGSFTPVPGAQAYVVQLVDEENYCTILQQVTVYQIPSVPTQHELEKYTFDLFSISKHDFESFSACRVRGFSVGSDCSVSNFTQCEKKCERTVSPVNTHFHLSHKDQKSITLLWDNNPDSTQIKSFSVHLYAGTSEETSDSDLQEIATVNEIPFDSTCTTRSHIFDLSDIAEVLEEKNFSVRSSHIILKGHVVAHATEYLLPSIPACSNECCILLPTSFVHCHNSRTHKSLQVGWKHVPHAFSYCVQLVNTITNEVEWETIHHSPATFSKEYDCKIMINYEDLKAAISKESLNYTVQIFTLGHGEDYLGSLHPSVSKTFIQRLTEKEMSTAGYEFKLIDQQGEAAQHPVKSIKMQFSPKETFNKSVCVSWKAPPFGAMSYTVAANSVQHTTKNLEAYLSPMELGIECAGEYTISVFPDSRTRSKRTFDFSATEIFTELHVTKPTATSLMVYYNIVSDTPKEMNCYLVCVNASKDVIMSILLDKKSTTTSRSRSIMLYNMHPATEYNLYALAFSSDCRRWAVPKMATIRGQFHNYSFTFQTVIDDIKNCHN